MKEKLKKIHNRNTVTIAIISVLLLFIVGIISIIKPNIKDIKVNKVLVNTNALSASVVEASNEEKTSNNYDEIKYKINIEKDIDDEAIIVGTLTDEENKYARFKGNKESEVSEDGKTIRISTKKNKITITLAVENAPYGVIINPKFKINSEDENKSNINVDPITITGKSIEGTISDENGVSYKGLELSLTSNNEEIKRTYSKENGEYVFSLNGEDNYQVNLVEEKYQVVRYVEETTDENRRILNIVIKEVEPFNLNIKKTISKLDLIVNGKKTVYNYEDEIKVQRSLKNAKTIEGSIYYNIYIKNEGEVKGTLTSIKDIIPDGLSFDEEKNPGWIKEGNKLFYTVLEGKEIKGYEKVNVPLILDIVKTEEAKSYINKAAVSGDDYKYVAYYINNQLFKEEYVIAEEKIENIIPNISNFEGWYTDKKYTNKYNFKNKVEKDLILYGKLSNNKYQVTFKDINPNTGEETMLDIKEVEEGNPVDLVNNPEYIGYTFRCFKLNNNCYDNEDITEDITLYTSYTVNKYNITYDLINGSLENNNPSTYSVKDEITLNNPTKTGYTFTGWSGTDLVGDNNLNVTIPVGSTGDRSYEAHYLINKSTLIINPNGGLYDNSLNEVSFTEDYGTIKVISNSEKRGYNFTGYNKVGGGSYQNNVFTFDDEDATLTAQYSIVNYSISYENITNEEKNALQNKTEYNVETNTFTLSNPSTRLDENNNPYQDFLGWDDGSGNVSTTVTIEQGSIGNRTYTAVWRENQKEYAIRYNLHEGTLEPGKTNPNTYTRQTESFTLNIPSKVGYTFTGWTGSNGDTPQKTVTISKGSAGDRV